MRISDWSSDVCSSDLCLEANLQAARLTSPDVIAVGVAVNTSNLDGADAAARACAEIEDALGLPCQDPVTMGMARIADRLQSCFARSEEHTSELQSLMRISYAVFCLKKKNYKLITYIPLNPLTYNSNLQPHITIH